MKNINKILLFPLLASLAVGCASPTAFQSSEYDDVYYSSKEKTIIQERQVNAQTENTNNVPALEDGVPNPEYSEQNSGTGNTYADINNSNDADYYSEGYAASRLSRYNTPYRGGLSYYDYGYNDFYWYNRNPFMYGRSAFYDPFYSIYDPFLYSPYGGFGYPRIYTGINIVIGQPFYGGFYGAPYYGGGFYRGFNRFNTFNNFNNINYYTNSGWYRNDTNNATRVQYGPRRDRSNVPTGNNTANTGSRPRNNSGGVTPGGGGGVVAPGVGGGGIARPSDGGRSSRSRNSGIVTPGDNVNGGAAPGNNAGRNNTGTPDMVNPSDMPSRSTRGGRQSRSVDNAGLVNESPQLNSAPAVRDVEMPSRRNNRRVEPGNYNFPDQPNRVEESQPAVRPRNNRNTENYSPAPAQREERSQPTMPREQQQPTRRERTRESQPTRTYEAPRQQERTYEAPRQRSYEAPTSRPSYTPSSTPSSSGSSSGGGSSRGRVR